MTSINRIDPKHRRAARRRNHIAYDLKKPKYKQRVVADKKKKYTDPITHRELVEMINEKFNEELPQYKQGKESLTKEKIEDKDD